jgi:hypothetical protein
MYSSTNENTPYETSGHNSLSCQFSRIADFIISNLRLIAESVIGEVSNESKGSCRCHLALLNLNRREKPVSTSHDGHARDLEIATETVA